MRLDNSAPPMGTLGPAVCTDTAEEPSRQSERKPLRERLALRVGNIPARSRYHRIGKKVQEDYKLTKQVLGRGVSGEVLLATSKAGGRSLAVKQLQLDLSSKANLEQIEAEVESYMAVDHPNIARLYDVYQCGRELHMVMELMQGGELLDRLHKRGTFSELEAADALRQMLLAVSHTHASGVVHRDLKLEHFMYARPGDSDLKLIDFGLSCAWRPGAAPLRGRCGTLSYCAPEVMRRSYTSQCDLWSLGVIAFIMLLGRMPFPKLDRMPDKHIAETEPMTLDKLEGLSPDAASFVMSLLELDPQRRLTAQAALQHPFIMRGVEPQRQPSVRVSRALRSFGRTSKFRRCCLHLVSRSLTMEDSSHLEEAFLDMDSSGRGRLTLTDLTNAFASEDAPNEEVEQIFEALDQNGDQEIQFSDFLAAMLTAEINANDAVVLAAVRKFDSPIKGCIAKQCMPAVFGQTVAGECVEELVSEVESQRSDRISHGEFAAFLRGQAPSESSSSSGRAARMRDRIRRAFALLSSRRPMPLLATSPGAKLAFRAEITCY